MRVDETFTCPNCEGQGWLSEPDDFDYVCNGTGRLPERDRQKWIDDLTQYIAQREKDIENHRRALKLIQES